MNVYRSTVSSTAPPFSRQFLFVVHDDATLGQLPTAAATARRMEGRLLVALAQPRAGFTTDPAIARFAARRADEALLRRERDVQHVLHDSGVDWTTVVMAFRDSGSATRLTRRLTKAAERLSRRRGVALLPTCTTEAPPPTHRSSQEPQLVAGAAAR